MNTPRLPRTSDPGLAAERTELAWGRSALSLFACGAAVAKGGIPHVSAGTSRPLVGGVLLVFGAVTWLAGLPLARQRARAAADIGGARRPARQRELAPVAIGTAVVGFAGFVLAAFAVS
ncbi:MAG: DUF202 domain-containing protein [Ilumatobacteraceae bacterium]